MLDGAWALNHALGYDMNSVEFAIKDGVPYAIDFTNPAPDMDVHSILPKHFQMVVEAMAGPGGQLCEGGATQPPRLPLRSVHRCPEAAPAGPRRGLRRPPSLVAGAPQPDGGPHPVETAVLVHAEHLPARQADQVDDGLERRRRRRADHHHPHLGLHLGPVRGVDGRRIG